MDTSEALDILSGDFTHATVHTPVPPKAQAKQVRTSPQNHKSLINQMFPSKKTHFELKTMKRLVLDMKFMLGTMSYSANNMCSFSGFLQPQVEDLSALDNLAGDFVAPAHAKKVFHTAISLLKFELCCHYQYMALILCILLFL